MSGNVREWCSDWYGPYNLNVQHAVNPKGAENGSMRICRGGGWKTSQWDSDVFFRDKAAPNEKSNTLGFRLVYSD